jgi:hypothetical protein
MAKKQIKTPEPEPTPPVEVIKEEAVVVTEESAANQIKSIFTSKTFWVNILAFIAFAAQKHWGFVIDESLQAQILMVINIVLRTITKDAVKWK